MTTEMEELKQNAEKQYARERFNEVIEYTQRLLEEMKEGSAIHSRSMKLELACMGTMLVTILSGPELSHALAFNLFLFVMFRNWAFMYPQLYRASKEFDGCITTLELLGMIDKNSGDKRRRRSKKYRQSWMEKAWEMAKRKKRAEAFA